MSSSKEQQSRDKLVYTESCNWSNCRQPARNKCSGCCVVFYCCQQHQKLDWKNHKSNCLTWNIVEECIVARKFINTGTLILVDQPLIVFRDLETIGKDMCQLLLVAGAYSYPCVGCGFGNLDVKAPHFCSKCSIPLCNEKCENNINHSNQECAALQEIKIHNFQSSKQGANISQDVFILRVIIQMKRSECARKSILEMIQDERVKKISREFLLGTGRKLPNLIIPNQNPLAVDMQYLFPISYKYCQDEELIRNLYFTMNFFSCRVNNTDGFGEKALYRSRILLPHSCLPNAEMWVDTSLSYFKLYVRAKCMIKPGEKITVCVDDSLLCLPTLERRNVLKAVHHIDCDCRRCTDQTECKLFVSGVRCTFSKCKNGYLVPKSPLDERSIWKCHHQNCKHIMEQKKMRDKICYLEQELALCSTMGEKTYSRIENFIKANEDVLHPNHFLMQKAAFHLGKIANYFLGSGAKLVLCVISEFKYASRLCERKNEYIRRLIDMHNKYRVGYKEDSGKLDYELACGTLALELLKFKTCEGLSQNETDSERLKKRTRELKKVYDLFKDAKAVLSKFSFSDGKEEWTNDATTFANILSTCLKPILHPPKDVNLSIQAESLIVKNLVDLWIEVAEEINLINEYKKPDSPVNLGGKSLLELLAAKTYSNIL